MASLQTIRNKGGVLVAIVIAVALAAFVLGDVLTSGTRLFGSANTAGEINGEEVTYQEYSEKVNYLQTIQSVIRGTESLSEKEIEQVQSEAWSSFVMNYAFLPQAEKLGIKTTEAQLQDLIYGANPSPVIMQNFGGAEGVRQFLQMMKNPQADPRLAIFWNYIQTQTSQANVMQAYATLVGRGFYVTKLAAEMSAELGANDYSIAFAGERYTSLKDEDFKVTETEMLDFYESHKAYFKTADSRELSYLLFLSQPSTEDMLAADKYINELAGDFKNSKEPMVFARANTSGQAQQRYFSADELAQSPELAAYAFSGAKDSIYGPVLNGMTYTMARIADAKTLPDSVEIQHIVLQPDQTALADSIVKMLDGGANFAEMATQYSLDDQSKALNGVVGPLDPQTMPEDFQKKMLAAQPGKTNVEKNAQYIQIWQLNKTIGAKQRVQLAIVNYNVEASDMTNNRTYARAQNFAALAGGTLEGFNKVVTDSMLSPRSITVGPNDRSVQGIQNSREMVSWAYNKADDEKVSSVMTFDDYYVVAALTGVSADGYQPISAVAGIVKSKVIEEKKKAALVAKLGAMTSPQQLATSLGDSVQVSGGINFDTYVIPGMVDAEPAIAGAVCAMKTPGKVSKPVVGNKGVYLVEITETTPNPTVTVATQREKLKAEIEQQAFMGAYGAFLDKIEVKDLRYKFY